MKQLAQRFGIAIPELEQSDEQRASAAERETLLKVHELAAAWFREQLAAPAGTRIRNHIVSRGVSAETGAALGWASRVGRDALKRALSRGLTEPTWCGGPLSQREDGSTIDRFRTGDDYHLRDNARSSRLAAGLLTPICSRSI